MNDIVKDAIVETNKGEKNLRKIIQKKEIEEQIYQAATCFALANPKWKSDGFVEYLVNWFK